MERTLPDTAPPTPALSVIFPLKILNVLKTFGLGKLTINACNMQSSSVRSFYLNSFILAFCVLQLTERSDCRSTAGKNAFVLTGLEIGTCQVYIGK